LLLAILPLSLNVVVVMFVWWCGLGVLDRLCRFVPGFGPEWGSGGIFGLRFHRGVLYFTLSFEAKAYFLSEDYEMVYDFSLVGGGPRSGGDTYNAVAAVDDEIFFGGWVHAPVSFDRGRRELSFVTKYSHLHVYDVSEGRVNLLWKEGAGQKSMWAGEVSEILYDCVNHRLLVARGDGFRNLGVYSFDLEGKRMRCLSDRAALKGAVFLDWAVFNRGGLFFNGLQCVDLVSNEVLDVDVGMGGDVSRDGVGAGNPRILGSMGVTFMGVVAFVKGGMFVGNPLEKSDELGMVFVRLFDFALSQCSPFRSNCLPVRGGLLVAYSSFPDTFSLRRSVVVPSLLVFVAPPMVKVVGVFGVRITSMEKVGSKIVVAGNTTPNRAKPNAVDGGYREVSVLSDEIVDRRPPPYHVSLSGGVVRGGVWGGFPLTGYRNASLKIFASRSNGLKVFEYDMELPVAGEPLVTKYQLNEGRNVIDLGGFHGVVSFMFEKVDEKSIIFLEFS